MESRIWHPRGALVGFSSTWSDALPHLAARQATSSSALDACYDDCDGAYKIALSVGKSDKLCAPGSSFMGSYAACQDCVTENTDSAKENLEGYLRNQFGEFIEYCEGQDQPTSTQDTEPTTELLAPLCSGCSTVVTTDWQGRTVTLIRGTRTEAETASLDRARFEVTKTVTHRTTQTANSEREPDEPNDSTGPDLATIIGPIVPSVVLLIVFAILGFRWYKKRQRIKDQEAQVEVDEEPKVEKAQLHSDCMPRPTYELEGSTLVVIDPISPDGAEMAANEVAAHEMSTDKKPGETRAEEKEEVQVKAEESNIEEIKNGESKCEQGKAENKPASRGNDATSSSK